MAIDVFLTYSPSDRAAASSLMQMLRTRGLDCVGSFKPGADAPTDEASAQRLSVTGGARAVAVVLSKSSVKVQRVSQEIAEADQRNIPLFIVNIGDQPIPGSWAKLIGIAKIHVVDPTPTEDQLKSIASEMMTALGASSEEPIDLHIALEGEEETKPPSPKAPQSAEIELTLDLEDAPPVAAPQPAAKASPESLDLDLNLDVDLSLDLVEPETAAPATSPAEPTTEKTKSPKSKSTKAGSEKSKSKSKDKTKNKDKGTAKDADDTSDEPPTDHGMPDENDPRKYFELNINWKKQPRQLFKIKKSTGLILVGVGGLIFIGTAVLVGAKLLGGSPTDARVALPVSGDKSADPNSKLSSSGASTTSPDAAVAKLNDPSVSRISGLPSSGAVGRSDTHPTGPGMAPPNAQSSAQSSTTPSSSSVTSDLAAISDLAASATKGAGSSDPNASPTPNSAWAAKANQAATPAASTSDLTNSGSIDKSAASIFSTDTPASTPAAAKPSSTSPHETGKTVAVAIATPPQSNPDSTSSSTASSPRGATNSTPRKSIPNAGTKDLPGVRPIGDNVSSLSAPPLINKPKFNNSPLSGSNASASAKSKSHGEPTATRQSIAFQTDPTNQDYQLPTDQFAKELADQMASSDDLVGEIKQQADEENLDIQQQIDRTTADVRALQQQLDAQIAALPPDPSLSDPDPTDADSASTPDGLPPSIDSTPDNSISETTEIPPGVQMAIAARKSGDLNKANKIIDKVLKKTPDAVPALKEKSRIMDQLRNPQIAMRAIERAVRKAPRDSESIALRAKYTLKAGDAVQAQKDFDYALTLKPDQIIALTGVADLKFSRGDWSGALTAYEQAIKVEPRFYDAAMGRGRALLELRKPLKSVGDFNTSLAIKVTSPEPWAKKSEAFLDLFYFGRAYSNANRAITVDPKSWLGHMARANVLSALGHDERAIRHLYWANGLNPTSALPIAARGRVFMNMGDWDQARKDYAAALALDANCLDAILGQAQLSSREGSFDDAQALIDRALQLDAACPEAFVIRSGILRHLNNPSSAIEQCNAALKTAPGNPRALMSLSITSLLGNNAPEAEAFVVKAIQSAPNLPQGYALRTLVAIELGNLERARTFADETVRRAPGVSTSHYVAGLTQLARGNNQAAFDAAEKALSLNSRNQGAMVLKARALIQLNQTQDAIKIATETLTWNDKLGPAYVVRAQAYDAAGDSASAKRDFQKARELDPQLDLNNAKLYVFDGF